MTIVDLVIINIFKIDLPQVAINVIWISYMFANVKTLTGLLPICSECKKIRNSQGYWDKIENYIQSHSEAQLSHSICESCAEKLYGKEDWYKEEESEQE